LQTRDLPLLKSLKTATVAPTPLAIRCTSDKTVLGKVHSMELGIYHEFPVLPGRSQAECFAAGFDIVDASEECGLDVMWLAELHFDKRRALAASPLVLGTAIAARTERIRIGTSVQVLPLANPLRIAEEAAILDHVSKGRLIFGVGRSGVVKTYEALNIAYSESKDREIECLEIIQRAWQEDNFSYKGKFYDIQDVPVVPQQVQLVQNATITGDAPGTLSRLATKRIQRQCAALPKITQEVPVSLQACHGGQRGEPGRGGPGILLRLQGGIRRQVGGNERDDRPGNEADRLLDFFPGAQAIGADDIDLRFGFVGLAALDNLRKAGARHATEIAPGHDHEVRVESLFGIHRRPELSDHLRNRDTAAARAGFWRKILVFNVAASDARLNVFPQV